MTALVLGGGGFVGRPLVQELRAAGARVVTTSRAGTVSADHARCAITDPASIRGALETRWPAGVAHLATVARGTAEAMVATNVVGTVHLLDAVREVVPSCRVVLFGSAAEYGDLPPGTASAAESDVCAPRSIYGVTKLTATRLALAAAARWNLRVTVVRPFNVVGAGCPTHLLVGAVIERMLAAWGGGEPLTVSVGRTDTQRDFIAVDDLARAVAALIGCADTTGIVNVCSGHPVGISAVLDAVARVAGRDVTWRPDPSLVRIDEPAVSVGDPARLAALTGYVPRTSLDQALAATWAHAYATFQTAGKHRS